MGSFSLSPLSAFELHALQDFAGVLKKSPHVLPHEGLQLLRVDVRARVAPVAWVMDAQARTAAVLIIALAALGWRGGITHIRPAAIDALDKPRE